MKCGLSVKYLGVIIDEKLNWSHIETKLALASNAICKTRNILLINMIKLVCYSIHTF